MTAPRSFGQNDRFSVRNVHALSATELDQGLAGWNHRYEQLTPGPFSGSIRELWLGSLQVVHEQIGNSFLYKGSAWKGARIFTLNLPTAGRMLLNGQEVSTNTLGTCDDQLSSCFISVGSYVGLTVAVDEYALAREARAFTGNLKGDFDWPANLPASDKFRAVILDTLNCVASSPQVLDHCAARNALQDRIWQMLLDASVPAHWDSRMQLRITARGRLVHRVIEFVEAHLAQPLTIGEICREANISQRALRQSFETVIGLSPYQYMLIARLNRVRRDLGLRRESPTIEEIALRWGFWHMGRFSYHYRRFFGERPSETQRQTCLRRRARHLNCSLDLASPPTL